LPSTGDFLDTLDPDAVVAVTATGDSLGSSRTTVLITVCVLALGAMSVWMVARDGASPSAREAPAATTPEPQSDNPTYELPDRVGVIDAAGNLAGFVDRAALQGIPNGTYDAWLREPLPVTKTQDPDGPLVGYEFRTAGFVDLATYRSPRFDVDALVAAAQAKSAQDSNSFMEEREQQAP